MKDNKRAHRRYKTQVYRDRQVRMHKTFFKDDTISTQRRGRLKTLSWRDCGRPNCQMCCGDRRSQWLSNNDKLTLQERRAIDDMNQSLIDLSCSSNVDLEAME